MDVDGVEEIVDINQSILGVRIFTLSNINVSASVVGTSGDWIEEEIICKVAWVMFIITRIKSVLGASQSYVNGK